MQQMMKFTGLSKRLALGIAASVLCLFSYLVVSGKAQHPTRSDAALGSLRQIGNVVARAILDKDTTALLRYDRADLRAEDESSLKNPKSDLYCFLFDSTCIADKSRSVFDKLANSRLSAIKVIAGINSKIVGLPYGS